MSIYHTKEYHVQLITNMVSEGIAGELLESYIESAYEAAHRQGWKQAKAEALTELCESCQFNSGDNPVPDECSYCTHYRVIAAMIYKEPEND